MSGQNWRSNNEGTLLEKSKRYDKIGKRQFLNNPSISPGGILGKIPQFVSLHLMQHLPCNNDSQELAIPLRILK